MNEGKQKAQRTAVDSRVNMKLHCFTLKQKSFKWIYSDNPQLWTALVNAQSRSDAKPGSEANPGLTEAHSSSVLHHTRTVPTRVGLAWVTASRTEEKMENWSVTKFLFLPVFPADRRRWTTSSRHSSINVSCWKKFCLKMFNLKEEKTEAVMFGPKTSLDDLKQHVIHSQQPPC